MRKLILLALLGLAACSNTANLPAVQANVTAGVTTACADLTVLEPLVPLVSAVAGSVPTGATDVVAANAILQLQCATAPAVEAMVVKLNADLIAAGSTKK